MKKAALTACLLLGAGRLWAATGAGTATATFLRLEQGTRGIGMGGAFVSLADDASSLWWNPAGMANAKLREVSVSYAKFVENTGSQFGGVLLPLSPALGAVGGSFTYFSVPGLDGFDANKNSSGKLTANSYAASLAYARKIIEHVSIGANFKIVGQRLATEQGTGFASDFGIQYRESALGLGVVVQNVGGNYSMAGYSSPLPTNVRAGVSFAPHPKLTLAFDEEKPRDGAFKLHVGGEWRATTAFSLRAGFQQLPNLGSSAGYTMGVGYTSALGASGGWAGEETPWWEKKMEDADKQRPDGAYFLTFDYAFVSYGDLSDTHRFSIGVKF